MAAPIVISTGAIIELAVGGALATGLTVFGVSFRKTLKTFRQVPHEMLLQRAAIFRLLRSNKVQGTALITIAECLKKGACNGSTEIAVKEVQKDQKRIDLYLHNAALGKVFIEEDDIVSNG